MLKKFILSALLCFAASAVACTDGANDSKNDDKPSHNEASKCDEASYNPVCSTDLTSVVKCKNGELVAELCPNNSKCDAVSATCTSTNGAQNGDNKEDNNNETGDECDPTNYPAYCNGSNKVVSCKNGKIVTTTCENGTSCNTSTKKCENASSENQQNNNVGAKGAPATFSESCMSGGASDSALYCDPDTFTVRKLPCTDYGDDYTFCDIYENYYGDGRNIVLCSTPKDECNEGDTYSTCEDDAKYDQDLVSGESYTETTYVCAKFALYTHYYVYDQHQCAKHCKDSSVCYEYADE